MPRSLDVLSIRTLGHLSHLLGVGPAFLVQKARVAPNHYRPRPVPKPNGGHRTLEVPFGDLMDVQHRIRRLLQRIQLPPEIHGSVRGKSVLTNAQIHIGKPMLLKFDLTDFFGSVGHSLVHDLFEGPLRCSPLVSRILTRLTTHSGHLPQGAPTSPAIANLIIAHYILPHVKAECERWHATPTFYVDDIAISGGKHLCAVAKRNAKSVERSGFKLNHTKTEILSNGQPQIVTGICVNRRPNMPVAWRKRLQAQQHIMDRHGDSLPELEREALARTIQGKTAFMAHIRSSSSP